MQAKESVLQKEITFLKLSSKLLNLDLIGGNMNSTVLFHARLLILLILLICGICNLLFYGVPLYSLQRRGGACWV